MKTIKKGIFLLVIALFASTMAYAQTKSIAQKADDLFDQKRFIEAYTEYEEAYNKVKGNKAEKNRIYFQMAECKRLTYEFDRAKGLYKRLANNHYDNTEPIIYFHLAEMCRFLGTAENFEEAAEYYDKYLEIKPDDEYAKSRKESLIYVNQLVHNKTRHVIIKKDSWSTQYNDWAPKFMGDDTCTIVFTSSRFSDEATEATDVWTGEAMSDLYKVYQDRKGNWTQTPELFDNDVINTTANEGQACFSPDGKTIYFTRCEAKENQTLGCAIYTSVKENPALDKDAKKKRSNKKDPMADLNMVWSTPKLIHLGDTDYNYLYPAITSDGLTLYFSANLPGGQGDYDLWIARRSSVNDDFGEPVNMGPHINTAGREAYPSLQNDTLLFFSSNGLPGLGGLDLYKCEIKNGRYTKPVNMGYPINTSRDEMNLIFYPESDNYMMERGYFSSNRDIPYPHEQRPDIKGKELPHPNDDIYYFELPPLLYTIEGTIRDEKSMQLVEHAKVKIVGSNDTEFETYTDKQGFYRFDESQIRRGI